MKSHPECINSSNPYHECSEYCMKKIAERKAGETRGEGGGEVVADLPPDLPLQFGNRKKNPRDADEALVAVEPAAEDAGTDTAAQGKVREEAAEEEEEPSRPENYESLNPMQKKLFDLRLKLNQARKANKSDIIVEKKRENQMDEPRGVSKKKWYEDKKRRMEKQLAANGLDPSASYRLDTQEDAEAKYKKWEKKETPFGWDVFNQESLYKAYKKRTNILEPDMEAYNKTKASDPEFYRDDSSLKYGEAVKDSAENVDRMVRELADRGAKRKEFSRRRKYHEDKDIDSINDRNEHFNRKIERAFGKYTLEIKNNLERGTALPD